MSARRAPSLAAAPAPPRAGWALWERQLAAVFALELRKGFASGRALPVYALAALPVALLWLVGLEWRPVDLSAVPDAYARIYQFELRMVFYFGCAWVFGNLFRGEVLDRSLHYYLLVPVRRDLLVLGKFLAGLFGATALFGATTVLSLLALYSGRGFRLAASQVLMGSGLEQLQAYLATTTLACIGYGALFLLVGLGFRNPFVPAVLFWGWEWLQFLLPPALKRVTVLHWLQSLVPAPIDEGTFALLAEPESPAVAVAGLVALSLLLLGAAVAVVRRVEIDYGRD